MEQGRPAPQHPLSVLLELEQEAVHNLRTFLHTHLPVAGPPLAHQQDLGLLCQAVLDSDWLPILCCSLDSWASMARAAAEAAECREESQAATIPADIEARMGTVFGCAIQLLGLFAAAPPYRQSVIIKHLAALLVRCAAARTKAFAAAHRDDMRSRRSLQSQQVDATVFVAAVRVLAVVVGLHERLPPGTYVLAAIAALLPIMAAAHSIAPLADLLQPVMAGPEAPSPIQAIAALQAQLHKQPPDAFLGSGQRLLQNLPVVLLDAVVQYATADDVEPNADVANRAVACLADIWQGLLARTPPDMRDLPNRQRLMHIGMQLLDAMQAGRGTALTHTSRNMLLDFVAEQVATCIDWQVEEHGGGEEAEGQGLQLLADAMFCIPILVGHDLHHSRADISRCIATLPARLPALLAKAGAGSGSCGDDLRSSDLHYMMEVVDGLLWLARHVMRDSAYAAGRRAPPFRDAVDAVAGALAAIVDGFADPQLPRRRLQVWIPSLEALARMQQAPAASSDDGAAGRLLCSVLLLDVRAPGSRGATAQQLMLAQVPSPTQLQQLQQGQHTAAPVLARICMDLDHASKQQTLLAFDSCCRALVASQSRMALTSILEGMAVHCAITSGEDAIAAQLCLNVATAMLRLLSTGGYAPASLALVTARAACAVIEAAGGTLQVAADDGRISFAPLVVRTDDVLHALAVDNLLVAAINALLSALETPVAAADGDDCRADDSSMLTAVVLLLGIHVAVAKTHPAATTLQQQLTASSSPLQDADIWSLVGQLYTYLGDMAGLQHGQQQQTLLLLTILLELVLQQIEQELRGAATAADGTHFTDWACPVACVQVVMGLLLGDGAILADASAAERLLELAVQSLATLHEQLSEHAAFAAAPLINGLAEAAGVLLLALNMARGGERRRAAVTAATAPQARPQLVQRLIRAYRNESGGGMAGWAVSAV